MLEYAWGNPSPILLSGEESIRDSEQTRQILDQYYSQSLPRNLLTTANAFSPGHHFQQQEHQNQTHFPSLHDSRAHSFSCLPPPMTSLVPEHVSNNSDFMVVTKSEEVSGSGGVDFHGRIGLNLGVRTYFSSEEDFVNRMFRRSRLADACPSKSPRCQSEGCNADLSHGKRYHRRHKVCEFHSKASTVFVGGLCQRFCQQCSRFHLLSEFDQGKRSCRRRLADHNRRRRKSQPQQQRQKQRTQDQQQLQLESNLSSPSENTGRSSPESGAHSSSSVTVTASPPRMTLLGSREYIASSPFSSSSSHFFSGR